MPGIQLQLGTATGNGLKNNRNFQVGSGETWTVTSTYPTTTTATVTRTNSNVTLSSSSVSTNSGTFSVTGASAGGYSVLITQAIAGAPGKPTVYYRGQINGTVGAAPTPTHSLGTVNNMNEGANQSISVTTTNFGSGTLYWSIDGSGDFTAHSGSVSISSNSGSFTISSIGDQATEGNETKTLRLRTGSTSGTQVDSATFTLVDTSTASGGSGSGGSGTGGSTTGTANYGLAVNGPNGSTVVFGTNLRTQNAVFSTTLSAASGTTYGPFSVANANDTSKIQITADYQVPANSSNTVQGSQMIITKSSTGFTFRHTAGGTKTFVLTAIQIG